MLPWLNRICALPSTRAPEFELGSEGPSIGNGGETALGMTTTTPRRPGHARRAGGSYDSRGDDRPRHNGLGHLAAHKRWACPRWCDLRPPGRLVDEVGERHGIAGRTTSAAELCARDDLDAVTIHTGDPFHAEPFCAAVAAGKHVFCEKPLANTVADLHRMAAAARDAAPDLKLAVGYVLRFNPVFDAIAAACHAGRLGQIYYQEADYIHNLLYQAKQTDPLTGTNWYLEHEQPVVGGGSHALDLLRGSAPRDRRGPRLRHACRFPAMRPTTARWRCSGSGRRIAKVASLYGPKAPPAFNNLRIYGPGECGQDTIALASSPDDEHPEFQPVSAERVAGHAYEPEVADWLTAISEDRPPRCELFDGANSTLACLLAVEATRTGHPVEVPILRR